VKTNKSRRIKASKVKNVTPKVDNVPVLMKRVFKEKLIVIPSTSGKRKFSNSGGLFHSKKTMFWYELDIAGKKTKP